MLEVDIIADFLTLSYLTCSLTKFNPMIIEFII